MTKAEIEAALKAAFSQCEAANCPLDETQKQILLQLLMDFSYQFQNAAGSQYQTEEDGNPLDQLTPEQRKILLAFVREQEQRQVPWKITLMNDWLHKRASGPVQFIRDDYGPAWLQKVQPTHLAQYAKLENQETLRVKVGDRIEVCNGLWEWVQDSGPCCREWFLCTVIGVREQRSDSNHTAASCSCTVRFDNGTEYEIQGMYEWNRYNWRWPEV